MEVLHLLQSQETMSICLHEAANGAAGHIIIQKMVLRQRNFLMQAAAK
jgi:hypothetical protein